MTWQPPGKETCDVGEGRKDPCATVKGSVTRWFGRGHRGPARDAWTGGTELMQRRRLEGDVFSYWGFGALGLGRHGGVAVAAAEELHALADHHQAGPGVPVLGLPAILLQPPLNQHEPPLLEELMAGLRLLGPDHDLDEAGLLLVAALAVQRDAELADRGPLRGEPEAGIPGQIAHDHHTIETGHLHLLS